MKVAVSRSQDRMLLVSDDLANPPDGKTYQLWTVADDTPRSMGTFEPTTASISLEKSDFSDADAVAMSVEPDGGSDTPTDIVKSGALPAA